MWNDVWIPSDRDVLNDLNRGQINNFLDTKGLDNTFKFRQQLWIILNTRREAFK